VEVGTAGGVSDEITGGCLRGKYGEHRGTQRAQRI